MLQRASRGPLGMRAEANLGATLRFLGTVAAIVLVFGACGSLGLGALDKSQTFGSAPLYDLGALFGYVGHFLGEQVAVITTTTTLAGIPFHNVFMAGFATTIEFCFISMPLALALGLMLALMSRSKLPILRLPARAYVEFFRNTPLIVQLQAIYTGVIFLTLDPFVVGVATLVLNYAAYECENLRAGIESLDRGQGEAASALGLNYWQTLRLVTIPQMITVVLPPVINDLIYMYKDSSILSLITIRELTSAAQDLSRRSPSLFWEIFIFDGLLYLVLSLPLARVARAAEERIKSVRFAPKRDLSVVALQVLAGSLIVGWIFGLLAQGISPRTIGASLVNIGDALLLTLAIMLGALVILGGLIYLPSRLYRLRRRRAVARSRSGAGPLAVATK